MIVIGSNDWINNRINKHLPNKHNHDVQSPNDVWVVRVMASRTHVQRVRILYKTILRLHRGLPAEVQPLGNNYVRDEFRRHKKCVESEAIIFLHEWTVSKNRVVDRLVKLQVMFDVVSVASHLWELWVTRHSAQISQIIDEN